LRCPPTTRLETKEAEMKIVGSDLHARQQTISMLPVLAFFALQWLPRAPKQALCVLALQVAAVAAALVPVCLLHL
jgi:hypothetical protein